ncbi:MAG: tetratricopeptide repeat protein [Verrucomicrobia bacterium]|nr:tetratricopeptide repeat protein [Verrucomicrobiota bacterium]
MTACVVPAATPRENPPASVAVPRAVWGAAAVIGFAALAAYANSFSGPFVFDDPSSIVSNPTIRSLWPPWDALTTPKVGVTVGSRPILNLSLAVNYAFGGTAVRGYHVGNLLIHIVAALALFGVVRRTLRRGWPVGGGGEVRAYSAQSLPLALAVAALWAVHPLQTESVTYVIQRAESLMGMFYLLTFYGFVRGIDATSPRAARVWFAASLFACLLGMGTKEVMVSAPVMVLLYDRTFVAGSFLGALRRRGGFYTGLASTWLYLAYLFFSSGGTRGGSAGFGVGVGWWDYVLTQFPAIAHYVRLSFWPHPLVFEYGTFWVDRWTEVLPGVAVVGALVAGTVWAFWRRPAAGFLGVFFFAILSVTTLVPGTTQMIVEHRMYLSLAPLLVAVVLVLHRWLGVWSRVVVALAGCACVALTFGRNADYRSELALWEDTVAKRPRNALAHEMLAQALSKADRTAEAVAAHGRALEIHPGFAVAQSSLGDDLFRLGRVPEAIARYEEALRLQPDYVDAHHGLGVALARVRRTGEAVGHFNEALRLRPDFAEAHFNLANTLAAAGQPAAAMAHYEAALRQRPGYAEAHYNLANTLGATGRAAEAIIHYEAALRARPDYPTAHYNLANTLIGLGRRTDAIAHYEAAVRLKPDYFDAQVNLGSALLEAGRIPEAKARYEEALRLRPGAADIREALARLNPAL